MTKDFVIINIGRNIDDTPMFLNTWLDFQREIRDIVNVYAEMVGQGKGSSQYQGQREEFATFHALVDPADHAAIRSELAATARRFWQDAIAYLVSTPDSLVQAAQPLDTYL